MGRPKKRIAGDTTTLRVNKDIAKRWSLKAEEKGRPVIDFTNEQLLLDLERDERLSQVAPNYSYSVGDDFMAVRCAKENHTYTVRRKDDQLYCEDDKSTECLHVMYAFATAEVKRLLLKRPKKAEQA